VLVSYPVNNLGQFGIITDFEATELPLNAFTGGQNVRFRNGGVEKFEGHSEVYATPLNAPWWLQSVAYGSSYFWMYAGETAVGATDGSSHADITRTVGGAYASDASIGWTGGVLGGIPVLNNGVDTPQYWATPALATALADLTNWPASTTCRALRPFGDYLVALDVTKAGTRYRQMVKWSHAAVPGSLPDSWDETDETRDAGEWSLSDTEDRVVDLIALRNLGMLYKEYTTHQMQYVAGTDIFKFTKVFESFGALSARCATPFLGGKHLVFSGDDVVLHDSQSAQSLLKGRSQQLILNRLSSTNYTRAFVAPNFVNSEIWICFPTTASTWPDVALVWNWKEDKWGVRDLPPAAFIASGIVSPTTDVWSAASGTWATDVDSWGDLYYDPSKRRMLMAAVEATKLYQPDNTNSFDGAVMNAYVERLNIGFPIKKEGTPDYANRKLMTRFWPRVTGTDGGTVDFYIGVQDKVDASPTYYGPYTYTIGSTESIDPLVEGRLHAIKAVSNSAISWRWTGYDVELAFSGQY